MENGHVEVSIVVIARNEEDYIERSLEAVMRESETVSAEVVFVDCGSTDRTCAIATSFPVRIVRMNPESILTASAARRLGSLNSTGELIAFVDGDCVLESGWLKYAVGFFEQDLLLAGVSGALTEVTSESGTSRSQKTVWFDVDGSSPKEASRLSGNAVYRRAAVDLVGGFNPYVRSLEEVDLCCRLRKAGYQLLYLPRKVATHYTEPRWTWHSIWRRYRQGAFNGYGQVLRSSVRNRFFMSYVKEERRVFMFLCAIVLGLLFFAISMLTGSVWCAFSFISLAVCLFLYMVVRRRSFVWPLRLCFIWYLNSLALLTYLFVPLGNVSQWKPLYTVSTRDNKNSFAEVNQE